ncbi:universal stress protein [Flavisphingomonas formosensis]|uniref:universal stress protein n=1 Tax=Flavisphingomonas formosensis TaxID=861534 RepID=UPI0012F72942|nr:universal stress protein [Sphingomonas formosensis]
MSYKSLLVRVQLGSSNVAVLRAAADVATAFGSAVIGVGACRPTSIASGTPYYTGDVALLDRLEIAEEAKAAEAEFRAELKRVETIEWRSAVTFEPLFEYFGREARAADLIVTANDHAPLFANTRHLATGDLTMCSGRPVLVVPGTCQGIRLDHVLLAWKDSREARRAAADALPMMKRAGRVSIVELVAEDEVPAARERLADVAAWLHRHGVAAETCAHATHGPDALRLAEYAHRVSADMIVAGAYGHSRMREWAFGGVTYDLLMTTPVPALLSH